MSITGSAGYGSVTTTYTTVYEVTAPDVGCAAFMVKVSPTSAQGARVNIPGLHAVDGQGEPTDWFTVYQGQAVVFQYPPNNIEKVRVKSVSGSADVEWGVIRNPDVT